MGIVIRVDGQAERPRVRVAGTVQAIRHDRIGGMPALEAELREGAGPLGLGRLDLGCLDRGCLDLIWLGRASIPGIEPGITWWPKAAWPFAVAARPCSTRAMS